ncbi:MAG: response regulator [Candidatus Liptonbacteria bacterium]|nr:response regulator [Candidatus Liptonbacteria bacterium]
MEYTVARILVVDDDEQLRDIYSAKLRSAGWEVLTAVNGAEGVAVAGREKPDLVLMDLQMPIMNGAEALAALRKDPATRGLKVVFLTAFGEQHPEARQADVAFARDIGALDYLKKGIDLDELVEKVTHYLALPGGDRV